MIGLGFRDGAAAEGRWLTYMDVGNAEKAGSVFLPNPAPATNNKTVFLSSMLTSTVQKGPQIWGFFCFFA